MSFLLPVLYVLLLGWWVWSSRPEKESADLKYWFWMLLCIKILFGFGLVYFYVFRIETGDLWKYNLKAQLLTDVALTDPAEYSRIIFLDKISDRSLRRALTIWYVPSYFFMLKVLSLLNLVTNSNIWLNSLVFTLFSFLGTWKLVMAVIYKWPFQKLPVLVACFVVPSVVFWSSGINKEALQMGCFGYVLAYMLCFGQMRVSRKVAGFAGVVVCLYIGWQVRYFLLVALGACLAAAWLQQVLTRKLNLTGIASRLLLFVCLLVVATAAGSLLHPNFSVGRIIELTVQSQAFIAGRSSPESLIEYNLEPTLQSVVLNAPKALFTSLYRPFVWEAKSLFLFLFSLENLALLLLTLAAIFFWRRNRSAVISLELKLALLAYVVITAVLIGLNTPNFGTILRYKVAFLPFLVFVLLSGNWWRPYWADLQKQVAKRHFNR